jgi:hypothetical protein
MGRFKAKRYGQVSAILSSGLLDARISSCFGWTRSSTGRSSRQRSTVAEARRHWRFQARGEGTILHDLHGGQLETSSLVADWGKAAGNLAYTLDRFPGRVRRRATTTIKEPFRRNRPSPRSTRRPTPVKSPLYRLQPTKRRPSKRPPAGPGVFRWGGLREVSCNAVNSAIPAFRSRPWVSAPCACP